MPFGRTSLGRGHKHRAAPARDVEHATPTLHTRRFDEPAPEVIVVAVADAVIRRRRAIEDAAEPRLLIRVHQQISMTSAGAIGRKGTFCT